MQRFRGIECAPLTDESDGFPALPKLNPSSIWQMFLWAVVLHFPCVERPVTHRHAWHVFPGADLVITRVQWKVGISQNTEEWLDDPHWITFWFQQLSGPDGFRLPSFYQTFFFLMIPNFKNSGELDEKEIFKS